MVLEPQDLKLFFELWLPLLDYVNGKCKVLEGAAKTIEDMKSIADCLWARPQMIDEYLAQAGLPEERADLVAAWKRCIPGRFFIERHLKKGSVFIHTEGGAVYLVSGLQSSWEEMLDGRPLPAMVDTTLIPFRGRIVTDGLIALSRVRFGRNYREELREIYMNAKKSGELHLII